MTGLGTRLWRRWWLRCWLPAWLVFAGAPAPASAAPPPSQALVGGTLIDGTAAVPVPDAVVVLADGRIERVGRVGEFELPDHVELIDVRGKWLIPGLIDAHVHFFQSASLYTRPDVIDLGRWWPREREIAWLRARLPQTWARYLASGVTGVIDMAGPHWIFAERDAAAGMPWAPEIAVAGPGLAPQLNDALMEVDPPGVIVRTPQQAREQVRRLSAYRPDLLKIWYPESLDLDLQQELPWIRAAVDEAHAVGLPVAAHAPHRELARAMLDAGVDVLVHSVIDEPLDADFVDGLKAGNVVYVTTLMVEEGYQEVLGMNVDLTDIERRVGDPQVIASYAHLARLFPQARRRAVTRPGDVALENLRRVSDAGVTVAAGSDAGNIGSLHGPALHRELELMRRAGMTPHQVLRAATLGGAQAMGRADRLGSIEPGKAADLVILDEDPLRDIRNTQRIHRVMKDGVLYDPAVLVPGGHP
jgi:imidazolonepropionase-like amidohydrolase